jgi:hypothetical protein
VDRDGPDLPRGQRVLIVSGYQGYAALVFAVGLCAAINLL